MFIQANVSFSASWGTGLIGQMRVGNDAQALNNWTIAFDVPFQIVNLWDATILSAVSLGNGVIRYTVGSAGWNATVPPGGGVSFGFEGRADANIQAQLTGITFGTTETLATPPAVTISDAVLLEGASGTKEMVFTIALSKPATETVTIPWSTQDGTALAGSDYQAASGSVTFAPGETSKTISVIILGDAAVEANETFGVVLGAPAGATLADGMALGTIQNDDVLPTLSIADAQVAEGNAGTKLMVFTVTLSAAAAGPVTVAYTTRDGTALAGSDYTAQSGSLSFAAGETSRTIAVEIRGDTVDEIDESFEIALSGLTAASFARSSAIGLIANDDAPPVLSISNAEVVEGNSGTRNIVFTLSLSKAIAQSVTASFATQDGTALAGTDYVAQSGSITFAAGETSRTISVAVNGDTAIEADETFGLVLSNVVRATLAPGGGTGTIRNDDLPAATLAISDAQVTEGNSGTKQMLFTVTLSRALTNTASVTWATQNGTAVSGSDYTAASGTLSFAAGEVSKTIAVTVRGDAVVEADETFSVVLGTATRATIADGTALGVILNDDVPPALSISDAQLSEGNSGTKQMLFTVTLSRAATSAVSVTWGTQNGTATAGSDYTAASGTLSFSAGQVSKTIAVTLRGDAVVEADETFTLLLGTATGATIADGTGLGTILNDDVAPPALSISDAQVTEGDAGTKQMLFTVSLSRAATSAVAVNFATQNGTATAGSDYVATTGTLSFAAGETSKTIAVTVNGDTAVETNESFNLLLSGASGATIADGTGVGTISNDDVPPSLTVTDAQVTEGDAGTKQLLFTVALSRAATSAVAVNFATQNGTATAGSDYVATSGTLSFAAGEVSRTIAVTLHGDTAVEADESFNLLLSNAVGATIADGTGVGTLLNDDVLPTLSIGDAQITEGNSGTAQMLFTVTLSRAMGSAVSVNWGTQNGTATAGSDYVAGSGTLNFAAGETSKTIAVAINGDAVAEANEGFSLLLSAANGATIADGTATGTILNDDAAASGDTASFRVTKSWNGGFLAEITVVNDATPIEGGWTLAFDAPFQIKTIWNAEIVSQSGSHYVIRNAPWNGNLGPNGTATFGIDVEGAGEPANYSVNGAPPPPVLPGLSIGDAFLTEGDSGSALMNFTISLSAAAAEAVTVQYATANGSALAGLDYQAASGSLTFAPGETSKILSVAVLGDTLREGGENFLVNLTAPASLRLLDGQATGTIRDNDAPAPSLPPPGWYSTSGNQIVDSTGETVRLKGVNWFGMEGYLGVPDGLYARNWQSMMDQMKAVGFDTIRLPFSLDNILPGAMPNNIVYSLNPDLQGLSGLQILDKIVGYAGDLGMKIILDCHRSSEGAGPNENGLWYDQNFSEAQWISGWQNLVQRYVNDSTVIGVDLQNEPHAASWADWSAAAERAGNAIHEVNPNLLIIVEGVGAYEGDYYWWGGQLEGVRDDPVVLQQANKLVYSPHDYPYTVYPNPWLDGPGFKDNLPNVFREHWGFIYEEGIAPIFVGEFGTELTDPRDAAWLDEIVKYMNGDFDTDGVVDIAAGQEAMSFAYWSWNPNSSFTGGILQDDWTNVHQHKLAAIEPLLIG
ncbi:cellulase family glycosylhydrolase [Roseococcus sp. SDR]|uniref:Calx-beta domain-containing protein n=1 Tax=Roseococcus sp. SDR TaxID=2835532 RepID=UPI001BCF19DB|nr:Calx-beta domain-containing protein [Roseococcus sp. SDR]MBS7790189.1 cellulase family glycosylhydrolase [Roseococcus sp. SDR]MBV1845503.1 cellulase family glycosylhydrolase [Roseococcus sp. SDR]